MAFIGDFDATGITPLDRSALPAGDYKAVIIDSEMKNSKTGGQYVALTLQIIEGVHKNRQVWTNLNLGSLNPKAVEIAQRELSAICHATGVMRLRDTSELHNKPVIITLSFVPAGEYPEKNEVKRWKPINGTTSATPPLAPRPAVAAPPVHHAAPPVHQAAPAAPRPAPSPVGGKPWGKAASAPVAEMAMEAAGDDIPF